MADTQSTPSFSRPWRVAHTTAGSVEAARLIQPNRLDVLIHFLAFEQLAGSEQTPDLEVASGLDWMARSEELTNGDHEIGVAALAAELLTSPDSALEVGFGSGGQLVRGAAAAAAALYSGRPITRIEVNDRVIDRSLAVLSETASSPSEQRDLLAAWLRIDPSASVVLIDLDAPNPDALAHELECRYPVIWSTIDHVSAALADTLGLGRGGSVRVMCLRADGPTFSQVLDANRPSVVATRSGTDAVRAMMAMLASGRKTSTSPAHAQRLRRQRRAELRAWLLANVRGD